MKTLIIVGYRHCDHSSTYQFLAESLQTCDEITIHNIADFESVEVERQLLKDHDRIILQFPVHWYSAPYELKQWIDKVFETHANYLAGKEFGIVATFGTLESKYRSGGLERFTIYEMLRPFEMLATYFKMIYLPPFPIFQLAYKMEQDKQKTLVEYQMYITGEKNMSFKKRGEWLLNRLSQKEKDYDVKHIKEYISHQMMELEDLRLVTKG